MHDPAYPLFGFGGCGIVTGALYDIIEAPWRQLKRRHFPQQKGAIHASRLGRISQKRLSGLQGFFEGGRFFRLAVLAKTSTANRTRLNNHELVTKFLLETVSNMLPRQVSEAAIVFETSAHGDSLVRKHIGDSDLWVVVRESRKGQLWKRQVPARYFFLPKTSATPGLEIADLITHAAGCHVRNLLLGVENSRKGLYQAIFNRPHSRWVRFLSIDTATESRK